MSFLTTDNIKQQLLPFVLDPKNEINTTDIGSNTKDPKGTPQLFSFRPGEKKEDEKGLINIFPDVRNQFNLDIGTQLLLNKYLKDLGKEGGGGGISLNRILNNLPGIQIREYTQQTRLESVLSYIKYASKGFNSGNKLSQEQIDGELSETQYRAAAMGSYWTSILKTEPFWDNLIKKLSGKKWGSTVYTDSSRNNLAINIVHMLYYNIVGSVTTNIYTIPNTTSHYLESDGKHGWPIAPGTGDLSVKDAQTWMGKLFNWLGGNVKIVTEPIWNASYDSSSTKIDIDINLFNDTYEHAINNFLFVNTIIPSNMPLQYGIWSMPPSAYDIKIEGGNRLYMCKGAFTCNNKGVLRIPPKAFFKELIEKHLNNKNTNSPKKLTVENLITDRIINIPDVYELKLSFESMLPNNINTYLEQFANNNNMIRKTDAVYNTQCVDQKELNTYVQDLYEKGKTNITGTSGTLSSASEAGKKAAETVVNQLSADAKKAEEAYSSNGGNNIGPVSGLSRQSAGGGIPTQPQN